MGHQEVKCQRTEYENSITQATRPEDKITGLQNKSVPEVKLNTNGGRRSERLLAANRRKAYVIKKDRWLLHG